MCLGGKTAGEKGHVAAPNAGLPLWSEKGAFIQMQANSIQKSGDGATSCVD